MDTKAKKIITASFLLVIIGGAGYLLWQMYDTNWKNGTTTYIDSKQRTVIVPNHPMRIISLSPSITEILFAIGAGDRVIGRTDYCDYPKEVINVTSVGGFSNPDLEKMTALNPDLIITANWNTEKVAKLESMNFSVVYCNYDNISAIIQGIRDIGRLVDTQNKANEVADTLQARYNQIITKTTQIPSSNKIKCYFEIWESPMVVGNDSYLNDVIYRAGGINIFGEIRGEYIDVSNENIIQANPDVIFITEHSAAWYSQIVCNRTGYSTINACKNNRIYSLDDNIFLREGPRIVDALENMTRYLYPALLN